MPFDGLVQPQPIDNRDTIIVLDGAIQLLQRECNWTKHRFRRTHGDDLQRCLVGAVADGAEVNKLQYFSCLEFLARIIDPKLPTNISEGDLMKTVVDFNDAPTRSYSDVMQLLTVARYRLIRDNRGDETPSRLMRLLQRVGMRKMLVNA